MRTKTRFFTTVVSARSLSVALIAWGLGASGCANLPAGLLLPGSLIGGAADRGGSGTVPGVAPGNTSRGVVPTLPAVPVATPTPVVYPTPAVAPSTPPDLIVPPASGSADPVALPSPAGLDPGSPTYGGGQPYPYPYPYPGGGGGPVSATAAPSNPGGGQGSFLSDQEAVVLQLTNQARAQAGVVALVQTQPLTTIAEGRSEDMATRNYFSHVNPDGKTVFDLLAEAGISYTSAGENIAMNSAAADQTAQTAFTAWMSDQGHKDNILRSSYGHIGIGVYQSPGGLSYLTQDFTN